MLDLYIGLTVAGVVILLYVLISHIYIAKCMRNNESNEYLRI